MDKDILNIISFLKETYTKEKLTRLMSECLLLACKVGNLDIVKSCLAQGADINFIAEHGVCNTPLTIAIENQHVEIVKYLLQQDVNIYLHTPVKYKPLDFAVQFQNKEIISLLLKSDEHKSYNLNLYRNSTIHMIANNNNYSMAVFLKEQKFKLSIDDPEPFYHLCSKGYLELIDLFVKEHVEEYILGKALSYALQHEQYAVVDYFIQNHLASHSYKRNFKTIKLINEKMADYFIKSISAYHLSQKLESSLETSSLTTTKIKI